MKAADVRRLEKLEARRHVGATCPACGHDPNAPVTFTFGESAAFPGPPPEDEQCPRCGRVLSFTIRFDSRMNEGDSE